MNMKIGEIKNFIYLHAIFFLYSLTAVLGKLSSELTFMSFKFIILYGSILTILFVYAILWQQIIKRMSLVTAYTNKAIIVVWGMIWGTLIFDERVTFGMIIGTIIIFVGIYLVASDE